MKQRATYFVRRDYSKTCRLFGFLLCICIRCLIAIVPTIYYNAAPLKTTKVTVAYMVVTLFFFKWAVARTCQAPLAWWNWHWHAIFYGLAFIFATISLFVPILCWVSMVLFADIIWSITTVLQGRPYARIPTFEL